MVREVWMVLCLAVVLVVAVQPGMAQWREREPMAELVLNGTFETDLSNWSTGGGGPAPTWDEYVYHDTPGSAEFYPNGPNPSNLSQDVATPTGVAQLWRFKFAMRRDPGSSVAVHPDFSVSLWDGVSHWLEESYARPEEFEDKFGTWMSYAYDIILPVDTVVTITFEFDGGDVDKVYLDDVSLENLGDLVNCAELTWELKKRRQDWGATKHHDTRYQELLNQAIREAPRSLWRRDVDTSLVTIEETRRYSLAALTEITEARQVRRVFVEASDEHEYEIDRWQVENDLGTLTLVLDEDPAAADRTIRLEYVRAHDTLDCTDLTDTTLVDREWLLARAMVLLLMEADPTLEDPRWLANQLQIWDATRQAREGQAALRPRPRKARSNPGARWRR